MLDAAPRRPIALFLGVLVLLSTAAALVLPDGARGESFETVGTIGADAEAHAITLHEGDRARFQLQPEAGEAAPTLRFALYDPLDRHFASFQLEGMGDHVEVLADQPGDWVVVVVTQRNSNLAVQLPEDQADDGNRVHRMEVRESHRPLVTQDGDALDERVAFRLSERPAVAFLRAQGTVRNLDATLASDEGPVYRIAGMSVNATHQDRGERTVNLANLQAGTFTVTALADHLNGSVDLVMQHYVRPVQHVQVDHDPNDTVNHSEPAPPAPSNDTAENTTTGNTTEGSAGNASANSTSQDPNATSEDANTTTDAGLQGLEVVRLQEEEPAWVRSGGASNLTLAVGPDTAARVLVYDGSDDLVHDLHLDAPHDHGGNGDTATVAVPEGDGFVVYVASLRGDGDTVRVMLHDADDTANATVLSTHATTLTLDGNRSANATLSGGLVSVHVETRGLMEFHREVNVTGPHGVVLEYEQSMSALGLAWQDTTTSEDHFGDGAYTARTDGGSGWRGEVTVTLVSYVR